MNRIILLILITFSISCIGQSKFQKEYGIAVDFMSKDDYKSAHRILTSLAQNCNRTDSLYNSILMQNNYSTYQIVDEYITKQLFDSSLKHSVELLNILEKNKPYIHPSFIRYECQITSFAIISYFGMELIDSAIQLRNNLYANHLNKLIPTDLNEYFFFTKFRIKDKLVQGIEWFEENLDEGYENSLSKIVYQIRSEKTNESDREKTIDIYLKLYHNSNTTNKDYYVLVKNTKTNEGDVSDILSNYTYSKNIDYKKLQTDIIDIVNSTNNKLKSK